MRAFELLIEDYERRLKTITESMERNRSNGSIVHQRREERLNTKASEYRTFIAELNRAMAVETSESTCNLQNVSGSLHLDEQTIIEETEQANKRYGIDNPRIVDAYIEGLKDGAKHYRISEQ